MRDDAGVETATFYQFLNRVVFLRKVDVTRFGHFVDNKIQQIHRVVHETKDADQ